MDLVKSRYVDPVNMDSLREEAVDEVLHISIPIRSISLLKGSRKSMKTLRKI
jgi:hypothetical protein